MLARRRYRRPTGPRSPRSTPSCCACGHPPWWPPTAVAIAMSEGPAAALAIVDELIAQPQTRGWAPVHVARANFLERLGRTTDALAAYRAAAALSLAPAERELIAEHIMTL